jgi:hypothetical protein
LIPIDRTVITVGTGVCVLDVGEQLVRRWHDVHDGEIDLTGVVQAHHLFFTFYLYRKRIYNWHLGQ